MTSDEWEWRKWRISDLIPKRVRTKGQTPGVTGAESMGPNTDSEQWRFPDITPSEYQLKLMMAACLAVGVATTFRLHTFTFGGNLYQQLFGGPIGLRLTCCVTKLRMINWMMKLEA